MSDAPEQNRERLFRYNNRSDLAYRVVAPSADVPHQAEPSFRARAAPASVVVHGTSGGRSGDPTTSVRTPHLTIGPTASSASVRTAEGVKSLSRHPQPPPPSAAVRHPLECPFDRTGCRQTFADLESWVAHSLTYFGTLGPPAKPTCPFRCGAPPFVHGSAQVAWRERMKHVRDHHVLEGRRLANVSGVDEELYRHVWKCEKIDQGTFKDIKLGSRTGRRAVSGRVNERRRGQPQ